MGFLKNFPADLQHNIVRRVEKLTEYNEKNKNRYFVKLQFFLNIFTFSIFFLSNAYLGFNV